MNKWILSAAISAVFVLFLVTYLSVVSTPIPLIIIYSIIMTAYITGVIALAFED